MSCPPKAGGQWVRPGRGAFSCKQSAALVRAALLRGDAEGRAGRRGEVRSGGRQRIAAPGGADREVAEGRHPGVGPDCAGSREAPTAGIRSERHDDVADERRIRRPLPVAAVTVTAGTIATPAFVALGWTLNTRWEAPAVDPKVLTPVVPPPD